MSVAAVIHHKPEHIATIDRPIKMLYKHTYYLYMIHLTFFTYLWLHSSIHFADSTSQQCTWRYAAGQHGANRYVELATETETLVDSSLHSFNWIELSIGLAYDDAVTTNLATPSSLPAISMLFTLLVGFSHRLFFACLSIRYLCFSISFYKNF